MRPGVPWNVKGIEAEAREIAQLAARRAGVSLGEWLSGLILTDGRGGAPGGYPQSQQQHQYLPGDGTYGPQPMPLPQYPPISQVQRVPQVFPQGVPQSYPQSVTHPSQQHAYGSSQVQGPFGPPNYTQPQFANPAQQLMPQALYGRDQAGAGYDLQRMELANLSGSIRELGDRFEHSEKRAQQAVASVNQSVAAMQDRIDAAERVKQLADAAFTSAADALAQSARDQSKAFESLESTVRSVQKRIVDVETGLADWPGKNSIGRLESALGQLQKRIGELDSDRADRPTKEGILRLEATLGQLQKRLIDMEAASGATPGRDSLARLETSITSMRSEVVEADRRTREDISQMAKFMRDLGTRVDAVERGTHLSDGITARFDALDARSTSMFDEIRGQMSAMDSRIAQAASNKNTIAPAAFAALKGSVEGIAARLDDMGDHGGGQPLVNSIGGIEAKLGALASKFEQSDKRTAESVGGVNAALKSISARIEDSDKRQAQAINVLSRRIDESDLRAESSARDIHKSIDDFADRLEVSDKRQKDSISGLRLTVDSIVVAGVADAVPADPYASRQNTGSSALNSLQTYVSAQQSHAAPPLPQEPDLPPFLMNQGAGATQRGGYSPEPPPPLSFDDPVPRPRSEDGYSLSALHTMLSTPISQEGAQLGESRFDSSSFDQGFDRQSAFDDPTDRPENFLELARRAAQAAAEREEQVSHRGKRGALPSAEHSGGRNFGRLAVIALAGVAVVIGIVAVLFTLPGSSEDGVERPDPGASIGEMLNGPTQPAVPADERGGRVSQAEPGVQFAPLPATSETGNGTVGPAAIAAPPNGMGVPTQPEPSDSEFTAGTSALPGTSPKEAVIASLESGAVRGDAKSQYLLSLRYSDGRGVTKDDARAASLATKAAQQGLAVAQYRLGALYERGVGVDKSLPQAKDWYEKSAKLGNRKAMHNLAVLLADSTAGQPNYKEAAHWFREGATYGLADSQYNIAVLLEQGMGVEKNLKEATTWYAIASNQGDGGATERLEALKKSLPPADVAIALDAARRFKPKGLNPAANDIPSGPG